jgi:predicted RNase H-like HicB family nuclease
LETAEIAGENLCVSAPLCVLVPICWSERFYPTTDYNTSMFAEYILAALERATYEIIDDPEPFYGEVPELQGVWATGKTLEECRKELQSVIEGWIALKLRLGHPIPAIGGHLINVSTEPISIVE